MEDQKHLDEQIENTQAVNFESNIQENGIEEKEPFFPDYSMLEHPGVPTVLTVNQPTSNAVVGLTFSDSWNSDRPRSNGADRD